MEPGYKQYRVNHTLKSEDNTSKEYFVTATPPRSHGSCTKTTYCVGGAANVRHMFVTASLTLSWCSGCSDWRRMTEHPSPRRAPSHRLLLPCGTLYLILIRINNWKKEINVCKLRAVTVVFIGLTLFLFFFGWLRLSCVWRCELITNITAAALLFVVIVCWEKRSKKGFDLLRTRRRVNY